MAYTIFRTNRYGYVCDAYSDLASIDTKYVEVGCLAKVVDEQAVYILNNQKQWKVWATASSSGSDGSIPTVTLGEATEYLGGGN